MFICSVGVAIGSRRNPFSPMRGATSLRKCSGRKPMKGLQWVSNKRLAFRQCVCSLMSAICRRSYCRAFKPARPVSVIQSRLIDLPQAANSGYVYDFRLRGARRITYQPVLFLNQLQSEFPSPLPSMLPAWLCPPNGCVFSQGPPKLLRFALWLPFTTTTKSIPALFPCLGAFPSRAKRGDAGRPGPPPGARAGAADGPLRPAQRAAPGEALRQRALRLRRLGGWDGAWDGAWAGCKELLLGCGEVNFSLAVFHRGSLDGHPQVGCLHGSSLGV